MKTELRFEPSAGAPVKTFAVELAESEFDKKKWEAQKIKGPTPSVKWRLLSATGAIVMEPLADLNGRRSGLNEIPACDHVVIYPVKLGYPAELEEEYWAELAQGFEQAVAAARNRGSNVPDEKEWRHLTGLPAAWADYCSRKPEPAGARRWIQSALKMGFIYDADFFHQGGIYLSDVARIRFRADFSKDGLETASIFLGTVTQHLLTPLEHGQLPSTIASVRETVPAAAKQVEEIVARVGEAATGLLNAGVSVSAKTEASAVRLENAGGDAGRQVAGHVLELKGVTNQLSQVSHPILQVFKDERVATAMAEARRLDDVPEMICDAVAALYHTDRFPTVTRLQHYLNSPGLRKQLELQNRGTSRAQLSRYLSAIKHRMKSAGIEVGRSIPWREVVKGPMPKKRRSPAGNTDEGDDGSTDDGADEEPSPEASSAGPNRIEDCDS